MQAQALYSAGLSKEALPLLARLRTLGLSGFERLIVTGLTANVLVDIDGSDVELFAQTQVWNAKCHDDADERSLAQAALYWLLARRAYAQGSANDFIAALQRARTALHALVAGYGAMATTELCRLFVEAAPMALELGRRAESERAIEAARDLVQQFDVPVQVATEMHANRAYIYSHDSQRLAVSRAEQQHAYAQATRHGLPRTSWLCLYLAIFDSHARGDAANAFAAAAELSESVSFGTSLPWKRLAHTRLLHALGKLGRLDDAEKMLNSDYRENDPDYLMHRCGILFKRQRYRECSMLANHLASVFGQRLQPLFLAEALLFRAKAAHRLNEAQAARGDIEQSIEIYKSLQGAPLVTLVHAYRLAYTITQRRGYYDYIHDVERVIEADRDELASPQRARALTKRQLQIAQLAADDLTNKVIAARLGVSSRTVGNHLDAIYTRLGIRARWQLKAALTKQDF